MHCLLQSLTHSVHGESEVQTAQWLPEALLSTSVLEPRQDPLPSRPPRQTDSWASHPRNKLRGKIFYTGLLGIWEVNWLMIHSYDPLLNHLSFAKAQMWTCTLHRGRAKWGLGGEWTDPTRTASPKSSFLHLHLSSPGNLTCKCSSQGLIAVQGLLGKILWISLYSS